MMANELLNRELFDTLEEAKVLLARTSSWVRDIHYSRDLSFPLFNDQRGKMQVMNVFVPD